MDKRVKNMMMSLAKQKKIWMIVSVVGVIMLIIGAVNLYSFPSWYSDEIPEYKEWEETETFDSGTHVLHVSASAKVFCEYSDCPREGDVIKVQIYSVTNGTIDVSFETRYDNSTLYSEDDVSSTYFEVTLQESYIFAGVLLNNTNWLTDKDVTMSISSDILVTKDNQEEIDNATAKVEEKRNNVVFPLVILGFIGFFVMLAGIGGWGDAVWKIRKEKRIAPTFPPVPSALPPQPPAITAPTPLPSAVTIKCPHCGANMQAGWKACPNCGNKLPLCCPNCGAVVQEGWKACPKCGEKL